MRSILRGKAPTFASVLLILIQCMVFVSALSHIIDFSENGSTGGVAVNNTELIVSSMMCLAMLVLIIMLIGCIFIKTRDNVTRLFILILSVNIFFLYFDFAYIYLNGSSEWRISNVAVNFGYYICIIILAWAYWHFVVLWSESKKNNTVKSIGKAIDFITCIQILLIIGNIFGEYFFSITKNGLYERSPSFFTVFICPSVILIICLVYILAQKKRTTEKVTLVLFTLFPFISGITSVFKNTSMILSLLVFAAVVIIYTNLVVRRDRELEVKKKELAESEVNSMLLQINPHFIYNTLGSVAGLCTDNPEEAKNLLYSFSGYLRNNFGEMTRKRLIPFTVEIEHLKTYVEIEKVRFPDITVEFNIPTDSFKIPSLTVQPLVENAISHGLMGREVGGTVTVSTSEDLENYYVRIEDDGVGFDEKDISPHRNHIGIANVRKRLEILCHGELKVTSVKGKGTIAVITIPKGEY